MVCSIFKAAINPITVLIVLKSDNYWALDSYLSQCELEPVAWQNGVYALVLLVDKMAYLIQA